MELATKRVNVSIVRKRIGARINPPVVIREL
jgi:hypothetical protein